MLAGVRPEVTAELPRQVATRSSCTGFVLSPDAVIKSIGFALGIAVLFDALVVRMTIVPAVMTLLGRSAWWLPTWLDRILPDAPSRAVARDLGS